MPAHNKSLLGSIYLFVTAVIFGSSFFIVKTSVDIIPPCWTIGIRFSLATLFLCVIFWKRLRLMNRATFHAGIIIGIFLCAAYVSQTIGITGTTPGHNAFLTALYVVIVPFMSWAVTRRRPARYSFIAAVICTAGIACISLDGDLRISPGDALSVLCSFLFAAQIVAIAYFSKKGFDPILLTIVQLGVTGAGCLIIASFTETFPSVMPANIWLIFAYLSFVVSGIAFLLQNLGQSMVSSSLASILLSLEAVFGVIFSVIFYGEVLTARVTLGFVLVFAAILVSETKLSFLHPKSREGTD